MIMEGELKRMGKLVLLQEKKQCTIGQMVDGCYVYPHLQILVISIKLILNVFSCTVCVL